ncbi:hypothetical protein PROFUN_03071 [Planoprotostelium fungivorum]|uniref:BOS complex subunit NCLN n=1 Tax=Planoprotostelium fungivorum TaxID=1890364 RepID=A0A2P6NQ46_9EUKA|nr:hypothetical protein PROFUN_03071 [Planoprotostelium fungivorum]
MRHSIRYLILLLCICLCQAAFEFPASRLAQLELGHALYSSSFPNLFPAGNNASVKVGSQRVYFAAQAVDSQGTGSLRRTVVLVKATDLTEDTLPNLVDNRNAEAILIVLPNEQNTNQLGDSLDNIQKTLLTRSWDASIYFAFEDEHLSSILSDVKKTHGLATSPLTDHWHFVSTSSDAKPVTDLTITNLQNLFKGYPRKGITPTLAVTASYDSFSLAPGAIRPNNDNGAVALLELIRLFSKLYNNPETKPEYNLLFLLVGGSTFNHAGTKHWANNVEASLQESLSFVLCLDDLINGGEKLNLHVSRVSRDDNIKSLYQSMEATAKFLELDFSIQTKKINVSDPVVHWQHEVFSMKKILAATLSSHSSSSPLHFNEHRRYTAEELTKRIRFVAESLANFIYKRVDGPIRQLETFQEELSPSENFVDSYTRAFRHLPIVQAYSDKEDAMMNEVFKMFKGGNGETTEQQFKQKNTDITFYTQSRNVIKASRVKPSSFDIILSLIIAAYFSLYYVMLKGPAALRELKELIWSSKKEKTKKMK